ncbi:MAG TPA: FGGY-family carbohydrate kinase, partial [Sphaerochaeta sp.]|nr:FGGY-family carbohydrate kinase [Sphaerochaeta sp.]
LNSGVLLPSGYGLLAHYAHRRLGSVPKEAIGFCGILEYITARLSGTLPTAADPSCLGTYGGFDPVTNRFDQGLLEEVFGEKGACFLSASEPFSIAGESESGALLTHAVGDNQAGFFGMVSYWETSALVSIGTSGQISLFSKSSECPKAMELRPFVGEGFLYVGATLTAGKAYERVQQLFLTVANAAGAAVNSDMIYALMHAEAAKIAGTDLRFDPRLTGSRSEPFARGSLSNITLDNLSMGEVTLAAIEGIVHELWEFGAQAAHLEQIVATGNAVVRNPLFVHALERAFSLPVSCARIDDGAGFGAALIAKIASGKLSVADRSPLVRRILGT